MSSDNRIITTAMDLFMRYGVKSITMDEVARTAGISKKTLYQTVENKMDLIKKVMQLHILQEKQGLCKIQEKAENAIDEMLQVGQYISRMLKTVNPSLLYDLKKFYPEGLEIMQTLHFEHAYGMIRTNLERGVKEGLYRDNLHVDIIARLYIGRIDLVIDNNLFPIGEYSFSQIHEHFITYHLYGLMSERGVVVFKSYQ